MRIGQSTSWPSALADRRGDATRTSDVVETGLVVNDHRDLPLVGIRPPPTGERRNRGTRLQVAVLANRRVIGEAIAVAIGSGLGSVAVGSTDPQQAHRLPRRPAAVVVVGNLTDGSTNAAVSMARRRWPSAVVVALADSDRLEDGLELVAQGADAWLARNCDLGDLRGLLERIASGDRHLLPDEVLPLIAASVREPMLHARQTSRLTGRELQVLICFMHCATRREVALMLDVSLGTVRTHVKNILRKLGLHAIQDAVQVATIEGVAVPSAQRS